jgi:hypothetical protein
MSRSRSRTAAAAGSNPAASTSPSNMLGRPPASDLSRAKISFRWAFGRTIEPGLAVYAPLVRPGSGGTVDYLVDAVFNYPTLAESYKVAALDALNKLQAISRLAAHS